VHKVLDAGASEAVLSCLGPCFLVPGKGFLSKKTQGKAVIFQMALNKLKVIIWLK
jgi:hypothetical protein